MAIPRCGPHLMRVLDLMYTPKQQFRLVAFGFRTNNPLVLPIHHRGAAKGYKPMEMLRRSSKHHK